ncbi:MAG: hypothetical protein KGR47_15355, partial [Acidobacteria bacterium]|nr:hypothetical protein [Acidobacteriota bacterium]
LPPEFREHAHLAGYYGHLAHNIKAVFQRYLSWYDGNPANLWKLPPVQAGERYVRAMGGADALLDAARRSFDEGDYRWVAELLNHLVFADPSNTAARELQADTFEQLGYQSESATFRNAYLTGAQELRNGTLPSRPARRTGYQDAMTVEQMFDTLAVRLKAEEVGGLSVLLNFTFTDVDEDWVLGLSNRALHTVADRHDDAAALTMRLTRSQLLAVIDGEGSFADVEHWGDLAAADAIFGHIDVFMSMFPLVEP